MVFPLLLLNSNERTRLIEVAGIGNFVVFMVALGVAVFDSYEYMITKSSITPLLATKSIMASVAPLVGAISMALTALLHLWAWVFIKDQHLRHTRWKTSAILEGVYISIIAIVITFACIGLHGFYWLNFKRNLAHGMFEAMAKANKSTELVSHLHDIQMDYTCCGVTGISDYFNASEINYPNVDNPFVDSDWTGCDSGYCYIPFSCCRAEVYDCTPWAAVLRDKYNLVEDSYVDEMYHQAGCVSVLGTRHSGLAQFIISGCLFLLQLAILALTMLVSTSTFVLEKVGAEEDCIVPSWILPILSSTPNVVVEHTYRCFATGNDFDRETLTKAVFRDRERLRQRTTMLHQMRRKQTSYKTQSSKSN
uniref:Tetraspanin/Peripherin n=1 Tax=Panagrellus redivivus TaxID=6233 RepID=A0A7E4W9X5_PANRE